MPFIDTIRDWFSGEKPSNKTIPVSAALFKAWHGMPLTVLPILYVTLEETQIHPFAHSL